MSDSDSEPEDGWERRRCENCDEPAKFMWCELTHLAYINACSIKCASALMLKFEYLEDYTKGRKPKFQAERARRK